MRIEFKYLDPGTENADLFKIYQKVESMLDDINSQQPPGLNTAFQHCYDIWSWLYLRMSFLSNASRGLVFSILMSLVILTITTRNIYVSLIATFCISSIILCMMSVIYL
jgi:hypothetical protein